MRSTVFVAISVVLTLGVGPAAARTAQVAGLTEMSAQARRYVPRLRVYPGRRLLYRDCTFRLAQQWRPSGTVIVPVQRCWWVRG